MMTYLTPVNTLGTTQQGPVSTIQLQLPKREVESTPEQINLVSRQLASMPSSVAGHPLAVALPADGQSRDSKGYMTDLLRSLHKERIMQHLNTVFENQSMVFGSQPDFAGLLSKKFGSCASNELEDVDEGSYNDGSVASSSVEKKLDEVSDDDNDVKIMARGHRQQQDVSLRVSQIEKILSTRKDLTKE